MARKAKTIQELFSYLDFRFSKKKFKHSNTKDRYNNGEKMEPGRLLILEKKQKVNLEKHLGPGVAVTCWTYRQFKSFRKVKDDAGQIHTTRDCYERRVYFEKNKGKLFVGIQRRMAKPNFGRLVGTDERLK